MEKALKKYPSLKEVAPVTLCKGVSDGNGDNEDARARVPHSCGAADALLSPDNKTHNPVLLQTLALTNSHSIISI